MRAPLWLRRLRCRWQWHKSAGSQPALYLHHPVPTHCERCDWTQGPWDIRHPPGQPASDGAA